jgi:hypothetical protein
MPTARDLLQRFRPLGAPGAAAPPGVPADRQAERGRELQPLFDALADAQEEAGRIRAAATAQGHVRRDQAEQQAAAPLRTARGDAATARAEAAAAVAARGEEESRRLLSDADAEAAAVLRRAEGRYAGPVEMVVRAVRESAGQRTPRPVP